MLGIEDPFVWMAYLLCLLASLLCVIYGLANWNRGDDAVEAEDFQWALKEEKAEEAM